MVTFVAKKSGGVKKKPMIILQEFIIFVLVSTSGVSDWQACDDSHWNKKTTFVFHKIVIYSPWTWKRSKDSLKISLTPKRSEFTGVKAFSVMVWDWGQNRSLHFVSCVFSVWSNKRCRRFVFQRVWITITQSIMAQTLKILTDAYTSRIVRGQSTLKDVTER